VVGHVSITKIGIFGKTTSEVLVSGLDKKQGFAKNLVDFSPRPGRLIGASKIGSVTEKSARKE
jgi:hypothetical protein